MENKLYSLRPGFKTARKRKGLSQEKVADEMKVTLKTVMNWEQGVSNPNLEDTMKLAELFDCDMDFLTGRIGESTHDVHFISEMTGLSEEAIAKISNPDLGNPFGRDLSELIESERFHNFISTYKIYRTFLERLTASDLDENAPWYELSDDRVILTGKEAVNHFKQEVSLAINNLCDENYTKKIKKIHDEPDSQVYTYINRRNRNEALRRQKERMKQNEQK